AHGPQRGRALYAATLILFWPVPGTGFTLPRVAVMTYLCCRSDRNTLPISRSAFFIILLYLHRFSTVSIFWLTTLRHSDPP
ncbi:hypothetical protein ACWTQY_26770, partial [Klebsiella pneumoniae]